jgi:hypothetical protein
MKKTAMQQLRNDILIELKLGYISEHSATRILNYIDALYIEKEKEQIMDTWDRRGSTIVPRYFLEENISGEQYYNQTYNNENTNSDSRL